MFPEVEPTWICPDLRFHWQLSKAKQGNYYVLCSIPFFVTTSIQEPIRWRFSLTEGYALRYFTGNFTVEQVQQTCQQACHRELDSIPPTFVIDLIQKLVQYRILDLVDQDANRNLDSIYDPSNSKITIPPELANPKSKIVRLSTHAEVQNQKSYHQSAESSPGSQLKLKPGIQWLWQSEGFWILRNPADVTRQLQICDRHKQAIARLNSLTPSQILQQGHLDPQELRTLLQQLAVAGMLVGIEPPKPPKRKFTPLQLLFFSVPLGNPDPWLRQPAKYLAWIWTRLFGLCLLSFLSLSCAYGLEQRHEFFQMVSQLWQQRDLALSLSFGLLALVVVSLHELGHALTLKHYNGIVPQVGLMFMLLFPAAYVNTTDQYALNRKQRSLVVGAGVICQVTIAAIGFWLWQIAQPDTWLSTLGFLMMMASLFTVAVNLNPLAKFDGYYLAVALTGINNLRSRSFNFYANLFRWQPIREKPQTCWILATYAPFSLAYSLSVFGFLLMQITGWTLTNIPAIALLLLLLWAIYFYFPKSTP